MKDFSINVERNTDYFKLKNKFFVNFLSTNKWMSIECLIIKKEKRA